MAQANAALEKSLPAYAELYRETSGEEESVEVLIQFLLAAFLRSDRVLKRRPRRPRARRQRRAAALSETSSAQATEMVRRTNRQRQREALAVLQRLGVRSER